MMRRDAFAFDALLGWDRDDFSGTLEAMLAVSPELASAKWAALLSAPSAENPVIESAVRAIWQEAAEIARRPDDGHAPSERRDFFERHFVPFRVDPSDDGEDPNHRGQLTGYYEPDVTAARERSDAYPIPLLARPADLVNLVSEADRALGTGSLTHARRTADGHEPYPTRAEIESGILSGHGLEIAWLADPVEAFFLHVQGSGRLVFEDGSHMRVTYDGKNGHPYTSIGSEIAAAGLMDRATMTLQSLCEWLRAHPAEAREFMHRNRSYVFFRTLHPGEADAAHGVLETPLHPLRSLAVDTRFHALGAPVFVHAPGLEAPSNVIGERAGGFARLMFAHDVGSAIRGRDRGDIFYGAGAIAGERAGRTNHVATLHPLLPVPLAAMAWRR